MLQASVSLLCLQPFITLPVHELTNVDQACYMHISYLSTGAEGVGCEAQSDAAVQGMCQMADFPGLQINRSDSIHLPLLFLFPSHPGACKPKYLFQP